MLNPIDASFIEPSFVKCEKLVTIFGLYPCYLQLPKTKLMYLIGLIKQATPRNLVDPKSFRTTQEVIDFFNREIRDFFDVVDPIEDSALRYYLDEPVPYEIRFKDTDIALLVGNQTAIYEATDQFTDAGIFQQLFR